MDEGPFFRGGGFALQRHDSAHFAHLFALLRRLKQLLFSLGLTHKRRHRLGTTCGFVPGYHQDKSIENMAPRVMRVSAALKHVNADFHGGATNPGRTSFQDNILVGRDLSFESDAIHTGSHCTYVRMYMHRVNRSDARMDKRVTDARIHCRRGVSE